MRKLLIVAVCLFPLWVAGQTKIDINKNTMGTLPLSRTDKSVDVLTLTGTPSADTDAATVGYVKANAGGSVPFIDVTQGPYNLKNDNSTDISTGLQAAFDAVCDTGGELVLKPGLYKLSNTVLFNSGRCSHGVSYNRAVILRCAGAFNSCTLMWNGTDGGDMIREGVAGDPTKAIKIAVSGVGFRGADASHKAVAINLYFGMNHSISENWFGDYLVNGIQGRGFYTSKIDHNWFAGPTAECILFPNDDPGGASSVNGNFITYNEFAGCASVTATYALKNISAGSGGSNNNVYAFNDFEHAGVGSPSIGAMYLIDNASKVIGNRLEDLGAKKLGYRQLRIAGGGNVVMGHQFGASSPMEYAITLEAGAGQTANNTFTGNTYTGAGTSGFIETLGALGNRSVGENLAASMVGGSSALSFSIIGNRDTVMSVAGASLTEATSSSLAEQSLQSAYFTAMVSDYGSPSKPVPPGGTSAKTFTRGYIVWNRYASYAGAEHAGWICYNADCVWSGSAWSGGTWKEFGMLSGTKRRDGTAAPTTGAHSLGEFVWNTSPTTGILGWLCTAAGTPGTWVSIQASALTLQTNGTNNGSQSALNLVAGANVTLTDNGTGSVTISANTASGGSAIGTFGGFLYMGSVNALYGGGTLVTDSAITITRISAVSYNTLALQSCTVQPQIAVYDGTSNIATLDLANTVAQWTGSMSVAVPANKTLTIRYTRAGTGCSNAPSTGVNVTVQYVMQ